MIKTLEKRIVLFTLLALTVVIVVNTAFNIGSYRLDYRDSLILRCNTLANGLKNSIEKVLGFGLSLQELSGINERCDLLVSSDPEIGYALVEDSAGLPVFGSQAFNNFSSSIAHLNSIENGHIVLAFPGQGRFYDVQVPFYDSAGHVAGRIRLGFPVDVLVTKTTVMVRRSVVVLVGAFAVACLIIVIFVKRDVVRPLRQLENIASGIAGGNFSVKLPSMATRELGEMARSLGEMARSLKSRDEEIRQNYIVLEESNRQLRESNDLQESVSAELSSSREMYRSLLDDASDAIIVSDADNVIVMINKAAEALFAISRGRAATMTLSEFLGELNAEDVDGVGQLFKTVLHGQSLETEIRFVRPSDKQVLIGWAKCSPIISQNGNRMVQTIVRDVTREREVKANLEKSAAELERLNTMKDSFLGVASHELKTPLTVILGYTELLMGEMSPLVGEQALPMIEHINRSAERLSTIVRDMVDVTLLDNQNIRLRCHNVDLKKLVNTVADEMDYFVRKRNQTLVLDLTDKVDQIWCDEERMNQVLTNLVSNAIKFTPDNGTVTIRTRYLENHRTPVGQRPNPSQNLEPISECEYPYIEIAIIDTGIGIAERDQVNIFDKFYEVGDIEGHFTAQSAFKGKGTGLGLTIAKGFVDLHDGEIWVESEGHDPDSLPGSTFYVLLPAVETSVDDPHYTLN